MAGQHESKTKAPLHGLRVERGDSTDPAFPNAGKTTARGEVVPSA